MTKCPLCGFPVSYVGWMNVDCDGRGCANYRPRNFPKSEHPLGTCLWARDLCRGGVQIEACVTRRGYEHCWATITTPFAEELPVELLNREFRYRVLQSLYAAPSQHPPYSLEWACDQERAGRIVYQGYKDEWWIYGFKN